MSWLIVRTDSSKEHYVAAQIENLGFSAWVPCQIVVTRPAMSRRAMAMSNAQRIKELPILPRRLFCAVPITLLDELAKIRHVVSIERKSNEEVIAISDHEIIAFRAEIDRENTAALALASRASKRQKAKWKSLHEALVEMIDAGRQQLELAA